MIRIKGSIPCAICSYSFQEVSDTLVKLNKPCNIIVSNVNKSYARLRMMIQVKVRHQFCVEELLDYQPPLYAPWMLAI